MTIDEAIAMLDGFDDCGARVTDAVAIVVAELRRLRAPGTCRCGVPWTPGTCFACGHWNGQQASNATTFAGQSTPRLDNVS